MERCITDEEMVRKEEKRREEMESWRRGLP